MIAANALFPALQTRSRFEGTRSEVYELMKRIREAPQEYRQTSPISCEGYLYVQEKRKWKKKKKHLCINRLSNLLKYNQLIWPILLPLN